MVIPSATDRDGYDFRERINPDVSFTRQFGDDTLHVFYETPRDGFSYGCSPFDVVKLLAMLPQGTVESLEMLIFRQPTKKQKIVEPIWGHLSYISVVGDCVGPAIVLEAQQIGEVMRWPRRLDIDDQAELKRLEADGHVFRSTKRHHEFELNERGVRNTLLYRTLLHELGHWVHFRTLVLGAPVDQFDEADEAYFSLPKSEKEAFAHRYARERHEELSEQVLIPFEPVQDADQV